jgi:hypothetical protein
MFKFEFTFATFAEAQQAMALLSASPAVAPAAKEEVVADIKAEVKARMEKAKEAPAPKSAPAAEPEKAPSASTGPAAGTATETTVSPSKPITLEEVRAKLAALSQAGKAPGVKALIADAGFAKLTDIPADQYPAILEKAAAL